MTMNDMKTPETYRGIKVPAELANRATSIEYAMWKLAVIGLMDTVVPLLEPFESEDPCRIDQNGDCHEHWFSGSGPCPVAEVKDFLDNARYRECVWVIYDLSPRTLYWCFQHRPKGLTTTPRHLYELSKLPEPGPYEKRVCVDCGRDLVTRD